MDPRGWAALFVVFAWWASTGVVLRLAWRPSSRSRLGLVLFGLAAIGGLVGARATAGDTTVSAAYLAFACALSVWGFHELAFLSGAIAGPRRRACPAGARGWVRFRFAAATLIHHEIALAATMALLLAVTWGAPNQVATGTFAVLWVMRLSAKINLFLGVRHFTEELVHPRHRYLLTYFRRDAMTPLLPAVLAVGGAVTVWLAADAWGAGPGREAVASTLLATLLGLAVLEHLFLAVPLPDALPWRWVLPASTKPMSSEAQPDV